MCVACCCTFAKVAMLIQATKYIRNVPALHPLSSGQSQEIYDYIAQHQQFFAGFAISCAFEFTFMCFSELLVLHRYLDLAFKGLNPTAEQIALTRRYFVAGCFAVACAVSVVICSFGGVYYRSQMSLINLDTWSDANSIADYFFAGQVVSEVLALAIKATMFVFISRMDLARLAKIERWTLDSLLPVRMCRIAHAVVTTFFVPSLLPSPHPPPCVPSSFRTAAQSTLM